MLPFIRICAVAACALPAVAQDPYAGTYRNDRMTLELAPGDGGYSGSLHVGGQTLPVRAASAGARLGGTFLDQGKVVRFLATRDGSQLTLDTGAATYILEAVTAAPPAFTGDWTSPSGPVRILPGGTAVLAGKPHRWTADGNSITVTGNGESVRIPFELAGDTWTWNLPGGKLVLTRPSPAAQAAAGITGAWSGPSGNLQINLDGTAIVAGVPYRYSRAGDQLTLSGPDGTFVATIRQEGDTMAWNVNGKTLTFQRAAPLWAIGGGEGIAPALVGKWCLSPEDCLTLLADGSFLSAGSPDRAAAGTWSATAAELNLSAKKTGLRSYRLERRNEPKTGFPLLVLDGVAYSPAYPRPPWPEN